MGDFSLISVNFDGFSQPATALIKAVSDAVGGIARPTQIERIAKAEAKADLIRKNSKIEISELERRALARMVKEEGQKQENIENITIKAIPKLLPDAKPEDIEKDWLVNFFDKSRLTSDEEMQSIWAAILAGEANSPKTFSKRTVNLVASLDKRDAELFTKLCSFCWVIGELSPIIFDLQNKVYKDNNITFANLLHLEDIGLISFNVVGYARDGFPKHFTVLYYDKTIKIEFPNDENNVDVGKVTFTLAGKELYAICEAKSSDTFFSYVVSKWHNEGYILSTPIKIKAA